MWFPKSWFATAGWIVRYWAASGQLPKILTSIFPCFGPKTAYFCNKRGSCALGVVEWHATVKPLRKHPIPSELGSETWLGPTSTELRDHLGTPGAVVFCRKFSCWTKQALGWLAVSWVFVFWYGLVFAGLVWPLLVLLCNCLLFSLSGWESLSLVLEVDCNVPSFRFRIGATTVVTSGVTNKLVAP